ncbi:polyadenylate-binding protein 1-like 2 [Clarias gariepinus]|uniref:polyadenylate-binding protein 1-like 2 n=1 Tax=Clarias gariepinus TaxID=13013 RepID=UPI00234CD3C1|nr:polyadenylate-binding protein 1-like 2 [Clarias gariepinus]
MNNDSVQLPTLWSGDLHPDVTESMLLQKFTFVGPVYSIQLCRNKRTGTSLQYAVVNFQQEQADGERVLEVLVFNTLLSQPIRITWSEGNSFLRKNKMGKDFIKTLEKSIDSMPLYNTLSTFGNVMSCKPVYNKNGCRGLDYVYMEKSESKTAIKRLTRMLINGQHL